MTQKNITSFIVDAFTSKAYKGNPAAICILSEILPDNELQNIAAEFNLSETAFLFHQAGNLWQLRWFTPTCEVNLCGHATLAAAYVLAKELHFHDHEFNFSTLSGNLTAQVNGDNIRLNFPKIQPELLSKIFLFNDATGISKLSLNIVNGYQAGENIILELANESELKNYKAEVEKIAQIAVRGLIITAPSENLKRDFVSRFFAPRCGINEDPVTGSAHCSLAILWSKKLGRTELIAEQLSARGGKLMLEVHQEKIVLIGNCITALRGQLQR